MRSDCSSVLSLHSGLEENLPSMPHSIINWMWSCEYWTVSWLPQNSYLGRMQLALPKPSVSSSIHGAGLFPSTPRTECASDGQGFSWGYIIVLSFYFCRNRNSHVCTVNCSAKPIGKDSQSMELKR